MKATMQATAPTALLQAGAVLIEKPAAAQSSRSVEIVSQPKAKSLTTLVGRVHASHRWENAVWLALAIASLVLVVMSFLI